MNRRKANLNNDEVDSNLCDDFTPQAEGDPANLLKVDDSVN